MFPPLLGFSPVKINWRVSGPFNVAAFLFKKYEKERESEIEYLDH
jgi:hypothetical protein